jgi:DNA-binding NtrC family response regulator
LRARAETAGFAFIAGSRDIAAAFPNDRFALCCMGLSEGDDAVRIVHALRKSLGVTPLVICANRLTTDVVMQLARIGVRDIVEWPAAPDAVAARVMTSASEPSARRATSELVGSSPAMSSLRNEIDAAARTASTVLVTGPTGSGKGVVARAIHKGSARHDRPFVTVDCGALAPTLVESELFGHERGAFTGASDRRAGRFELAADGVVFLDEIGDMDLQVQRKLLRLLQDRVFERLGGARSLVLGARVIAATHRDLTRAVEQGRFRMDLLYRLNVIHVAVPALSAHSEDIPALVDAGLREIARRLEIEPPTTDDELLASLMAHEWPGNVRELMHTLERLVVRLHTGTGNKLRFDRRTDTGVFARGSAERPDDGEGRERPPSDPDGERERFGAAMLKYRGNVSKVARHFGLARSTLRYRLQRHALDRPPIVD